MPILILSDKFCEEQAFSYLLPPSCKFANEAPQDIPISSARLFKKRFLKFYQYFAPDVYHICLLQPWTKYLRQTLVFM